MKTLEPKNPSKVVIVPRPPVASDEKSDKKAEENVSVENKENQPEEDQKTNG